MLNWELGAEKHVFMCMTNTKGKKNKKLHTHTTISRGVAGANVSRQFFARCWWIYIKSCSNATAFFCNFLWTSKRMPERFSSHVAFYNATAAQMSALYARLFKPDPTDYRRMIFKAEDRNCYRPPRQPVTAHCELRGFEFSHLVWVWWQVHRVASLRYPPFMPPVRHKGECHAFVSK